ncbi:MAG: GNAT family N-acetyltransferase [Deltaproteobacteria bacterium]|nr:GNAT family N-acetyltransferase [Deltaproteobacteria bacterium]
MSNRGRFGKYGEMKRFDRLRQARVKTPSFHGSEIKSFKLRNPLKNQANEKTSTRIRLANISDVDFIGQLSGKVFNIYGPYDELVPQWFGLDFTVSIIAIMVGKPVGFAMIGHLYKKQDLHDVSELMAIAVEPEKQKMGIGKMLIREMEKKASELNIQRIFLHTAVENLPAQRLFVECGYQKDGIKSGFYPAGQDAVVMSKNLSV